MSHSSGWWGVQQIPTSSQQSQVQRSRTHALRLCYFWLSSLDGNTATSQAIFFLRLFYQFLTVLSEYFSISTASFELPTATTVSSSKSPNFILVFLQLWWKTSANGLPFHDNWLEALPKKPEELVAGPSTSTSEWPPLLASQRTNETSVPVSSIQPRQKAASKPRNASPDDIKENVPTRLRKGQCREVGSVLPRGRNPFYPRTDSRRALSFIITDLRSWRLAGVKKRRLRSY